MERRTEANQSAVSRKGKLNPGNLPFQALIQSFQRVERDFPSRGNSQPGLLLPADAQPLP
jgi:hypothetical protein